MVVGGSVRICYVDEAGCPGALPSATSNVQPVLVVCGLVFRQPVVQDLTREFISLKQRFYPDSFPPGASALDWILVEVKGAELRQRAVVSSRRSRRHALSFLDNAVGLLETSGCRVKGRVWVKGIGQPFNGRSVYTSSIQYIHHWFNEWLEHEGDEGLVVCDSRDQHLNRIVSHSIFTQKYSTGGDRHPRILEMPTFGHSENHAGIQLADLVSSALLFPMAIDAYCSGSISSVHVRPGYASLRVRYGARLERLQYRVPDPGHIPPRYVGGVMVDDQVGRRSRSLLFGSS